MTDVMGRKDRNAPNKRVKRERHVVSCMKASGTNSKRMHIKEMSGRGITELQPTADAELHPTAAASRSPVGSNVPSPTIGSRMIPTHLAEFEKGERSAECMPIPIKTSPEDLFVRRSTLQQTEARTLSPQEQSYFQQTQPSYNSASSSGSPSSPFQFDQRWTWNQADTRTGRTPQKTISSATVTREAASSAAMPSSGFAPPRPQKEAVDCSWEGSTSQPLDIQDQFNVLTSLMDGRTDQEGSSTAGTMPALPTGHSTLLQQQAELLGWPNQMHPAMNGVSDNAAMMPQVSNLIPLSYNNLGMLPTAMQQMELGEDPFGVVHMESAESARSRQRYEHHLGEHPSRTLFVRNINSNVEEDEIRRMFEQYGAIRSMHTQCKHRGFVMISYYDIRHAKTAMRCLHGKVVRRRRIDIHYSIPKENPTEKDQNQGTLVVFNLDSSVTNEELELLFGRYGEVKEIRETPNKKHHKFVEFYDVRDAHKAMKHMNKTDVRGKKIKIEASRPGGARKKSGSSQSLVHPAGHRTRIGPPMMPPPGNFIPSFPHDNSVNVLPLPELYPSQ